MNINDIVAWQREYFRGGETKDLKFRLKQLEKLQRIIEENTDNILEALREDLNKSSFEGYATEVGIVLDELKYLKKRLPRCVKPKRIKTPVMHFPSSSYRLPEPYGVVLIMSPWNYPFQLTMTPLIGALAAGNCAVIKPSNYSTATSKLMVQMIRDNFEERYIAVLEGGREANQAVLKERFDYIFFTGSVNVGRIVMESASRDLTPITLELGGKSPCIVSSDADIDLSARRIIWGKLLNAGQTCVAPDYVMVHRDVKDMLIVSMIKYIQKFYGEAPCSNPDYPRIINPKHFNRLMGMMDSGKIVIGGSGDEINLKIAPTILDDINWGDPVMGEEIFGPILPIIEYTDIDEVIQSINGRPKPLALYLFTKDKALEKRILRNISFGGGCINDTIVHLATPHMPFGGVGESGMGGYHGKASFDTFSHYKSIMKKSNLLDIPFRYPPYRDKLGWLKRFMG